VVGGTSSAAMPENATRPIRVRPSWSSTKVRAASVAAVSRFGATSVAHIEPDTSRASMIVLSSDGTASDACGRVSAPASASSPARKRITGIRRRHCERPGRAARISATLDTRRAARLRRRFDHQRYASSSGTISRAASAQGQLSDIR
jgi:hypothetical protein